MKKLFIAFACAAMAVCAHAATVNWSVTGITEPGTTTKTSGYIGYFFQNTGSKSVSDMVAAIQNKTFDTAFGATAMSSKTSNTGGAITVSGLGSYSEGTYNFYTVLFDAATSDAATNYIITDDVAVTYTSATGFKPAAFTNITGTSGDAWTAISGPEPIPEPTSGMLLMLGVGLMALKRRR